jgi:hypothetical protein
MKWEAVADLSVVAGIAAETADFEVAVTGIERITERRQRLCRSFVTEHALIPCFAGQSVGLFARLGSAFSRSPDQTAVNGFA